MVVNVERRLLPEILLIRRLGWEGLPSNRSAG
jgi:hypothetical protein